MTETKIYKLAVFERGSGKPLVMLHGMISTHRYWNQVIELLPQNKWRVISPDLLGFGDSPKPKDALYNVDESIETIDTAITSVAMPPYVVVGHSMGAGLALQWAVAKPYLFKSLVLTSMPLLWSESRYRQLSTIVESRLFKREKIAKAGVRTLNWVSAMPLSLLKRQKKWPEHITEDLKKHSRKAYRKILKNAVLADEMLNLAKKVNVPTHIIIGSRDGMIDEAGREKLKKISKTNKNVTLEIVDSAHNLPLEHPEIIAKAIMQV